MRLVAWLGVAVGFVAVVRIAGSLGGSSDTPSVATAPAQSPPPAAAERSPYAASVATFRDDLLDECVDFRIVPKAGQEAAALKQVKELASKHPPDGVRQVTIAKPCAEQFPDRTALATCALDRAGTLGRVVMADRYFSLRTVGDSDAYMKDCLTMHGDWRPNQDKQAVEHERIRQQMAQLQKMATETE